MKMENSEELWFCKACRKERAKRGDKIKIGTLNCRGLKCEYKGIVKKHHIAEDMKSYNLDILAIQETHVNTDEPETIKSLDGKSQYMLYHSYVDSQKTNGKGQVERAGVAIAVREGSKATFTPVSNRLCQLQMKQDNNMTITVINAYAPTLPVSEESPEVREQFYDQLESLVRKVKRKDYLIIAGDFNAKTGDVWRQYSRSIGKYGKGKCNSNGIELLEMCSRNDLVITNTCFKHKMAHRTTWESPKCHETSERRNPYRNQIDYLITRRDQLPTFIDSRSHNGLMTHTDHRLVRGIIDMKREKKKRVKTETPPDLGKFKDPRTRAEYTINVEMKIMDDEYLKDINSHETAQDMWDKIVRATSKTAEETLGKKKKQRYDSQTITNLSEEQKHIHQKINSITNEEKKGKLRIERNKILNELHREIGREKEKDIEREIKPITDAKNDSNRMYAAVRGLQRLKKKVPLVVSTEDGSMTTDTEKQLEVVTAFFEDMFVSENVREIEGIQPKKMKERFDKEEVKKAVHSLKNGKSPGIDEIRAEYLKHSPDIVYEKIADLLNHIAETGETQSELKTELLVPLQKPGKKRGPASNLRPVILLSILRKIMAVCLIGRIGEKIDKQIPLSQAAYRSGRGTTEQVLAMKLMAEKAVTTPGYKCHLMLMDMSKAFDRVDRYTMMEDLKRILEEDELHLVKILIEDVKLTIKINNQTGRSFTTNIGTPQGDCLSPILFTLYLANAMKEYAGDNESASQYAADETEMRDSKDEFGDRYVRESEGNERKDKTTDRKKEDNSENRKEENHKTLPPHLRDHCYSKLQSTGSLIQMQYADDIGWLGMNCSHRIEQTKKEIPDILSKRNLIINEAKTEEYIIEKGGDQEWSKCKYLGTRLDTKEDITSRKRSANNAIKSIEHITKDRRIGVELKMRAFNAYVASIFLYNSETWTISKTTANTIDSFHRRLLRYAVNIRYPAKISNEKLYKLTKEKPWSQVIKQRRLRFTGHVLRLPEETPVRQALSEYQRPLKRPRGAPKFTWQKNIDNDLRSIGMSFDEARIVSKDRKEWRIRIGRAS